MLHRTYRTAEPGAKVIRHDPTEPSTRSIVLNGKQCREMTFRMLDGREEKIVLRESIFAREG